MGATEHQLVPLARGVANRHAEFVRALRAMAHRLNLPVEYVDPPPDINTDRFERALDVHAGALAELLDASSQDEGSDPRGDPVARVLHHERRYWRRTTTVYELPDPSRTRLNSAVAAATLFGAATDDEAIGLLGTLSTFHGEKLDVINRFVRWLKLSTPDRSR